jgi:hypothetical protein
MSLFAKVDIFTVLTFYEHHLCLTIYLCLKFVNTGYFLSGLQCTEFGTTETKYILIFRQFMFL